MQEIMVKFSEESSIDRKIGDKYSEMLSIKSLGTCSLWIGILFSFIVAFVAFRVAPFSVMPFKYVLFYFACGALAILFYFSVSYYNKKYVIDKCREQYKLLCKIRSFCQNNVTNYNVYVLEHSQNTARVMILFEVTLGTETKIDQIIEDVSLSKALYEPHNILDLSNKRLLLSNKTELENGSYVDLD